MWFHNRSGCMTSPYYQLIVSLRPWDLISCSYHDHFFTGHNILMLFFSPYFENHGLDKLSYFIRVHKLDYFSYPPRVQTHQHNIIFLIQQKYSAIISIFGLKMCSYRAPFQTKNCAEVFVYSQMFQNVKTSQLHISRPKLRNGCAICGRHHLHTTINEKTLIWSIKLPWMCDLVTNLQIVNSGSRSCHTQVFWSLRDGHH
jgi:hypothetical protein